MTFNTFCVGGLRRLGMALEMMMWLLLGGLISSQAGQSGDFGYTVDTNNTVTITNYTGPGGAVTIPDTIEGLPVTVIGSRAFYGNTNLTGVTMGTNVALINGWAFRECTQLYSVALSPALTNMEYYAFGTCSALAQVILPDSLVTLGSGVFFECASITNIVFGTNVTSLGVNVFAGCSNLASVVLPKKIEDIPDFAFEYCIGLTNVDLPAQLRRIGNDAFYGCYKLAGIQFPETLAEIWGWAFGDCASLTNVVFPDGLTTLGTLAFGGCELLTKVTFPRNLSALYGGVFASCTNLTHFDIAPGNTNYYVQNGAVYTAAGDSLVIYCPGLHGDFQVPDSVRQLNADAFDGCVGLTSVSLGKNITTIGRGAFWGCSSLTNIMVDPMNPKYSSKDGVLFSSNQTVLLVYPNGLGESYVMPNTVTAVATTAFVDSLLKQIVFSPNLIDIQESAFSGSQLTNVVLPNQLRTIGDFAFAGCENLTNLVMPGSLNQLGMSVFQQCSSLISMCFLGNRPWVRTENILFYGTPNVTVYRLENAFGWFSSFGGRRVSIGAPQGLIYTQYTLAADNTAIVTNLVGFGSVELPESVDGYSISSIGPGACANNNYLTSLTFPDSITSIGDGAFAACTNLQNVTFGAQFTSLGNTAFAQCPSLTGLYFKGNAPEVADAAVFDGSLQAVCYYLPGTSGWGSTLAGRPTAIWNLEFAEWAEAIGLVEQFPEACGEQDDADHDGFTNAQEMRAGTSPKDAGSRLVFESTANQDRLAVEDQTPLDSGQFALYFQSVPGMTYELWSCDHLGGEWSLVSTLAATTTQKRVVLDRPSENAFYRVAVK